MNEFFKDHWKKVFSGACLVAGVLVLTLTEQMELGAALMAAAGVPYVPLKKAAAPLLLAAVLALPSCQTGMISVSNVENGLMGVLDRHDTYVKADTKLDALLRGIYLRTTELIRKVIEEAKK
jgi:hypothetical protein